MGLHIHNKSMPYMYDPEEIYLLSFLLMRVKSFFRVPHHWQRVFSSPFLLTPAGHRCLPVCETDILWKNIKLPARTKSQDQNRNSAQTCETGLFVCLFNTVCTASKKSARLLCSFMLYLHCKALPGISWEQGCDLHQLGHTGNLLSSYLNQVSSCNTRARPLAVKNQMGNKLPGISRAIHLELEKTNEPGN